MISALPRPKYNPAMEQPSCAWCRCFPCVCTRETPCVCGGTVLVEAQAVSAGVRTHQRSQEHRAWRERSGL